MVCDVCGTRNLADEVRCLRCGARLIAPAPEPELVPERELTPGERLAVEAREQLAAGDPAAALRAAQRAAVMEPDTFLCRLVLGDVHLELGAVEDALREFRRAAEIDPDSIEAKEKAELARRRLTHGHETDRPGPRDWRARLVERKPLVAIAAGIIAGLLVFTVGAAAIVSRTSPEGQLNRLYREQMSLGRDHYRAGRYELAAQAFEQAWRLKPNSTEAKRRLDDALAVAGLAPAPATAPSGGSPQIASIGPANDFPPMPPRWVGPAPASAQPGRPLTGTPPPPIPEPDHRATPGGNPPELPPPMPDNLPPTSPSVDRVEGPPRIGPPSPDIGAPATEPPPAADTGTPPTTRTTGSIMIRRHDAPRRTPAPAVAPAPSGPSADALRADANRLRDSGNAAAAAQRYGEAAARYRAEAAQGGAGAATKRSAADSCERAQQACQSQGN